jgi:hypothetical protein
VPTAVGTDTIGATFSATAMHLMSGASSGLVVGKASAATAVASVPNPSVFGQSVTFTATVVPVAPGAGSPTGTVTFSDSGIAIGSAPLSGGTASVATAALVGGVHSITASYSGDGSFTASASSPYMHTVSPAGSTTTLESSPNPSLAGQSVSFTAIVTSGAGVPTGSVNFLDGATVIGSGALSGGTATFSTASLTAGTHSITAAYGGDASHLPSTSAIVVQAVSGFYAFTGFLSPMQPAGTIGAPTFSGTATYGSAKPVKWQLQDASGHYISDLTTATNLSAAPYAPGVCTGQASGTPVLLYSPTAGAKGGSTFRYDTGSNQFIFNWNTGYMAGPGCYELELQLNDGSAIKATIEQLQ